MEIRTAAWGVLGASVVGTSHTARGLLCQDAHQGLLLDDGTAEGTLIVAVADGAGSAARSGEGALEAVRASTQFLAGCFRSGRPIDDHAWEALLCGAMLHARRALEELAAATGEATLRDFASTLLLTVATETHVAALQLGDGAIVFRSPAGALEVLAPPAAGEYVNETTFLTAPDPAAHAVLTVRPAAAVDGLALLTDGLQALALELATNTAHAPFFAPLFDYVAQQEADGEELVALLASDRVNDRTDDDKTLVLAVRRALVA